MWLARESKRQKTLFLVRGLAGSGKTTLASALSTMAPSKHGKVWTVSADDYFIDNHGFYNFVPNKLRLAHNYCQNETERLMKHGVENIVVHNTFSRFWEMGFYQKVAKSYEYSVFMIECQNEYGSVHDVPEDTVERMRERFERA